MTPKKPWSICESCGAPLRNLSVGGMGDWRNTITCKKCLHTRVHVPDQEVFRLTAEQYNSSPAAMREAQSDIDHYWLLSQQKKPDEEALASLARRYNNEARRSVPDIIRESWAVKTANPGRDI